MPAAKTAVAGNEFKVKLPGLVRSVRVDPNNDSIVYVTSYQAHSGARVFRSSNLFLGNVQWSDLTSDLPAKSFIRCFDINPQNDSQMIVGTSAGLYVSGDAGQHWEKELQFPNVDVLRSGVRHADNRLFLFTYGRGAWAASFPPVTNSIAQPGKQFELKVWPNPTQGTIHVAVPEIKSNTSIEVWSVDGKLVKSLRNFQHTPVAINLSDQPTGQYLIRVYDGKLGIGAAKVLRK